MESLMSSLQTEPVAWDTTGDDLQIPEAVAWLRNEGHSKVSEETGLRSEQLESWLEMGPVKQTLADEDRFCDRMLLQEFLQLETNWPEGLSNSALDSARNRANPFEQVGRNIFSSRSAVKLANLDVLCNVLMEQAKASDLFYVANVFGDNGGCAEYVLWRKKWRAKVFGIPRHNFRFRGFASSVPSETFQVLARDPANDDDGGWFCDPSHLERLIRYMLEQTGSGVHLMVTNDASIRQNNNSPEVVKELALKRIFLCEVILALATLRPGGHLILNLFEVFTSFTVGLVYLVHRCFGQISICKPNSTRSLNSERFLIAKGKLKHTDPVLRYLRMVNEKMQAAGDVTPLALVAETVLREDRPFYEYIRQSNYAITRKSIAGQLKRLAFVKNPKLVEPRQAEVKRKCLTLWNLPNTMYVQQLPKDPDQYVATVYRVWNSLVGKLRSPENKLQPALSKCLCLDYAWHCVPIGPNLRVFLLGMGNRAVFRYDLRQSAWVPLRNIVIELPAGTILYGEFVNETFHIIDGLVLGGEDIRRLPLAERNARCRLFAKALQKPPNRSSEPKQFTPVVVYAKTLQPLVQMKHFLNETLVPEPTDGAATRQGSAFEPQGLLFLRDAKIASFEDTVCNRVLWEWTSAQRGAAAVSKEDVLMFIENNVTTASGSRR
ncbi:cap-specific mRNA (nucleoside-2'-O-)-methyltransferase 1-like [Anopheles bellator]|uniref:cap-specific mRNA (nucleoside-2'-O-)-methyltransferase 1-like n=1 Tax=Anopheles bellator TaxID=139047 RepID=UPI002647FB9D|nr:cap-specific mRNA (nucleoside-2'-O-)-methyltransferase 1-like [Anopheles bellator]